MPIELQRRRAPADYIVGKDAVRLVSPFEGLSLKAYPDPASQRAKTGLGPGDPWTIGYGRTHGVNEGDTCTLAQADQWLIEDLNSAADLVKSQIVVPLTPGEFTALVSIVFNLGYIPRSLKAALNGGTSDKGDVYQPGSYGSALKQFPRNCRAAGVPMRGLLRRRLAEACVFSDLPWENACSVNVIKLALDAKGNIDTNETTSLEDTLARARQDIPIYKPAIDVTKPWPTTVTEIIDKPAAIEEPIKPEIIVAPKLPVEDELLLDQPASAETSVSAGAELPELRIPAPVALEPAPTESVASPDGSTSATATPASTEVASAPELIDRSAPVAPVETPPAKKKDTMGTIAKDAGLDRGTVEKAITAWLVWLSSSLRSLGANGMKIFGLSGSSLSVIADQLQQPFVQIMVATAFFVCLTGGIWFVGLITEKAALRVKVKAERAEAAT